jgi:glycosyltransferase involved in cell wall biosynthesis
MELGLDPSKACVIRPAVDADFFQPATQKRDRSRFTLVSTGSLVWRKGYEYSLQAVRKLIDAGVETEYHILGQGPDRQRLLFTIHDLGLQGQVFLHGSLPREQVREWLQKADTFVLASLSEGISNSVLEAMACGLPVVTSNCGGMSEAITEGVEGYLIPPRDPDALAAALLHLSRHPQLAEEMGISGRARVLIQFDLQRQVRLWLNILVKLTSSSTQKIEWGSEPILEKVRL